MWRLAAAAGRQQATRGNCRSLSLASLNEAEIMSATYAHQARMKESEEAVLGPLRNKLATTDELYGLLPGPEVKVCFRRND